VPPPLPSGERIKVRGKTPRPSNTPLKEGNRPRGGLRPPRWRGRRSPFVKGGVGGFEISPCPSLRKRGMNTLTLPSPLGGEDIR